MYLSKLELDIHHSSIRQALSNCQDMHRNLMNAFDGTREEAGVLYRLIEKRQVLELYVLSREKPQWEKLQKFGYWYQGMKDISALKEYYREGAVLHFEILTFPSKKIKGEGKNSRRVFLKKEEERKEWFFRQAEKYGFEIMQLYENGLQQIFGKKSEGNIRYCAVCFQGYLKILDAETFWENYQKGIGAGKSYGLGLLLLSGR